MYDLPFRPSALCDGLFLERFNLHDWYDGRIKIRHHGLLITGLYEFTMSPLRPSQHPDLPR